MDGDVVVTAPVSHATFSFATLGIGVVDVTNVAGNEKIAFPAVSQFTIIVR